MLGQSDNSPQRNKLATVLRYALACVVSFALTTQPLYALPTDGVVAGGQATISAAGKELNVTQSTDRAVIDWKGFDIAADERATFVQPSINSVTLNRVTGGQSASQILGRLEANGNLMIVNSNGVVFGAGSQVNVGGLIATSSDIDNTRFMNGDFTFDKAGNPDSEISNAGNIEVREGGLVGLVAPNVTNTGHIRAKLGKVQLASGDTFAVDLYGDGLIKVEASDSLKKQLVKNSGKISADGGEVLMSTAAAKNAVNGVINMDGIIEAKSVGTKNGKVTLYAEGSNAVKGNITANKGIKTGKSTAIVSGKIDVTGDKGGVVNVLADQVGIYDGAVIDASGKFGGGAVYVGGNYLGQGNRPSALYNIVQSNTNILANATEVGNGGTVIVWADKHTDFTGNIQAKGGALGGNGGFVETSGKEILSGGGAVDASAANGLSGTWLLDPYDITITGSGFNSNFNISGNTYTSTGSPATWLASSLSTSLSGGTSIIIKTGAGGGQAGNITVAANISKGGNSAATLTLDAHNNIIVNSGVTIDTSNNGNNNRFSLVFTAQGGSITVNGAIDTNGGNATFTAATGITINGSVSVDQGTFVGSTTLGNFTIGSGGSIVSTATTGTGITIASSNGNFINNNSTLGAAAVTVGTGSRYLIYSKSEAGNTYGGLTSAFSRYGCTYGGACAAFPSTGNGFIYRDAGLTLTATPSALVLVYGDAAPTLIGYNYTLSGYATGDAALDTVTGSLTGTTTYTAGSDIGSYNINYLSGSLSSLLGYGFVYANNATAITVNKKTINTALQGTVSKTYDGNTIATLGAGNYSLTGVYGTDAITIGNVSGTYDNKNAGTGKTVTVSGLTLSGTKAGNYQLGSTTVNGAVGVITKRDLIVSATGSNKVYDGNTTALVTLTDNRIAGDVFTDTYAAANYSDKNVANGKTITVTGIGIGTSTAANNYNLTNTTATTTGNITKRDLIVSATGSNKVYDGNTTALVTLTDNRIAGDVFTDTYAAANYSNKNVGTGKTITVTGIGIGTSTAANNYNLTNTTATTTGNITKRDLIVTARGQDKIYDGNTNAVVTLRDNRISGDVFTDTYTDASFSNKNVGNNKTITVTGIGIGTSTAANNYNLTNTTATTTADIERRALFIDARGVDRVYDGTTNATVTLNDNRITGDVLTTSYGSANFTGTKNVGTNKVILVSGLGISGDDAGNYYVGNLFNADLAVADITKRDLIVSATGSNKVYDGNTTALVTLTDNRIAGDVFTDTYAAANYSDKNVANGKTITVTGIGIGTSTAANNYNLTNTTATTTGNITKRDLIVSATGTDKVYDGNTSAVVSLTDNRVAGDVFNTGYAGASFDNKNAGTGKTVTVTGIAIAPPPPPLMIMMPGGPGGSFILMPAPSMPYDGGNYNLVSSTVTTTANITPRDLNVFANAESKVYDGNTNAVVTFNDNRISGDVFNTNFTSANFSDKNVGGKLITVNGISISNPVGGGDAGNYNLLNTTSFTKGQITPRDLIVGATGQDKGYDGNTKAVVTLNDNRIVGDLITVTYTGASFVDKNAGNNKNVNVFGISLLGAGSPPGEGFGDRRIREESNPANNYRLVNTTAVTTADITPASLKVAGNNQAIVSGAALPNLTFTFSGFIAGETDSLFTGALATVSPNSPVGTYNITQGTLSAGSNYAIAYTNGLLTIASSPQGPNVPANQVNSTNKQGQNPGSDPFNPNQGQNGTLLSLFTGGGGNNNNPADLNAINPAGGEDEGEALNAINPAGGGNNGNTIPLIECTPFEPCDIAQ